MKRRLREMEEGTEKLNPLYEQSTSEHTTEPTTEKYSEKLDENKKTNFVFPVISDHEIYGWEPQAQHEEQAKEYSKEEPEEEYDIVPLYQNERWPGRDQPSGKIYRAETKREIARIIPPTSNPLPLPFSGEKRERTAHQEPLRIEPEETKRPKRHEVRQQAAKREEEPVKIEKPKKFRRPFSPTHVPSPIYGLKNSSPISEAMESVIEKKETKDQELHTKLENHEEELPLSLVANHQPEESPLFASSTEKRQPETPSFKEREAPLETVAEEIVPPMEEMPVAHEEDDTDEVLVEPSETVMITAEPETTEEVPEPVAAEPIEEAEQSETEAETEEITIEAGEPVTFTVEEEIEEEVEPAETETEETEPSEPEIQEEAVQPEKKEKVVPFNVLMLKSDKEKLAARVEELIAESAAKKERDASVHEEAAPAETVVQEAEDLPQTIVVEPRAEEPESAVMEPATEVAEVAATETIIAEPEEAMVEEEPPHYGFPTMEYLAPPEEEIIDEEWLAAQSATLEETLSHFAVQATVVQAVQGPAVTMFELTVVQGTKVSKIRNLTDDLKLALAAKDIRIQAPIPGTSMIGIEIPNRKTRAVRISEVIDSESFANSGSPLEAVLGLSLTGEPQTLDLRKMPHGMIAGATGSGKSVCINSILISLLYKASHHDLKLLLIDPKMVELAPYNGIPHLLSPVITDVKAATAALKWAVNEMERRYELFAHSGVRNIERYNEMVMESRRFSLKMPYIVVVIDELADLMMMAPADVEVSISRITQKARACGIHLIIATQRPSVDVITGTIKANIPTRIAFAVSSQVDSRTILDSVGADRLLGKGDMLYLGNGQSAPVRLQGTFVTDDEIERIIEHVRNEAEPDYLFGQDELLAAAVQEEESDPLFEQACSFVIEQGSASTSSLQRHFSIGYNRAAKLIDRMEANQFISEQRGSRPRDVFLTEQAFESFMK